MPALGDAVAAFTLLSSVMQCLGPVATGAVADFTGSLATGLGASAAVLVAGAALALFQHERSA